MVPKERGRALSLLNYVKPASCVPRQCRSRCLLLALPLMLLWLFEVFMSGRLKPDGDLGRRIAPEQPFACEYPHVCTWVVASPRSHDSCHEAWAGGHVEPEILPNIGGNVHVRVGLWGWAGPFHGKSLAVDGGALLPARWYSPRAEQSQDETLLCRPVRVSRFLCLCLDFRRLNWASAAKGLQPRGQGYCLFLWLSLRATQTGRRTDINTPFVPLWMLLLLPWTISSLFLSDFSSFSDRCTFSLSWRGGKWLEKGWQNPFALMLAGCCHSMFSSFCRSRGAVAAASAARSSRNASQLPRRGCKFFLGKLCWELCVFSLLSREFIIEFIMPRSMTPLIFPQRSLAFSFQRGLDRS